MSKLSIPDSGQREGTPRWAWAVLAVAVAYLALMYSWVLRIYLSNSIVLKPWLLNQPGYRLYENVIDMQLPGSIWLQMALYRLLPDPLLRARLSMIVLVTASIVLVFWLARRWWGLYAGLAAAILYAAWGPVVMDRPMYFDVLLGFLTLGALSIWHRVDAAWWRPVLAGILVGLGVLVKQHELSVVVVFIVWRALGREWRTAPGDIGRFLLAVVSPVLVVVAMFAIQGRLDDALFWTWEHPWTRYLPEQARGILRWQEIPLLVAWLAWMPLFALYAIPRREQWQREGILLLGLLPALCSPAFPRYGRFHLSGAVPVAALIGAGALTYAIQTARERGGLVRHVLWLYGIGGVAVTLVALILPTYYRAKLGPRVGEYEALIPIAEWVAEETGAGPGARVWLLPEYDPVNNLHAITGYLPPTLWVQTATLRMAPETRSRMVQSLESEPPQYAVLIDKWRSQIPDELLTYLEAHYTPVGEAEMPIDDMGTVTLYKRLP